ncbi:SDR family NAD(P)-dependent oxidoreductase [Microbacteriaceae bacterium K1510]|nr:SDR family NAD(P)-dependent oxidoreductase [Microbacteriaceae bacterium K1510]
MKIEGQVAVVTGGASGLGFATAEALAHRGAKVAILDINPDALRTAAETLSALGVVCDVRKPESAAEALATVTGKLGLPGICINCAGVGPAKRILGKEGPMPLEDFARVIDINVIGTFNMLRLVAAEMAKRDAGAEGERGIIINTASIAAYEGQIGQSAYAASKGAVASLTIPAARELAQFGIRVLAIAPGIFLTPMLKALPETAQQSLGEAIPFPKRLGRPDEYAALALHMIENVMLNGEVVRIDGAIRLAPR